MSVDCFAINRTNCCWPKPYITILSIWILLYHNCILFSYIYIQTKMYDYTVVHSIQLCNQLNNTTKYGN